jgi:hypothetical protein
VKTVSGVLAATAADTITKEDKMINNSALVQQLRDIKSSLSDVGIQVVLTPQRSTNILLSLSLARKSLHISYPRREEFAAATQQQVDDMGMNVVAVSKKHRQAVLVLTEPARQFSQFVSLKTTAEHIKNKFFSQEEAIKAIKAVTTYPRDTTYEFPTLLVARTRVGMTHLDCKVNVPPSKVYFLVGFDEKHMFVSMLPKAAASVADAHAVLMPKSVRGVPGVIRQGEFFFVPVTKKELALLKKKSTRGYVSQYNLEKDNSTSDHRAYGVSNAKGHRYITGVVGNSRHDTFLTGWYRVVPNTEQPGASNASNWD